MIGVLKHTHDRARLLLQSEVIVRVDWVVGADAESGARKDWRRPVWPRLDGVRLCERVGHINLISALELAVARVLDRHDLRTKVNRLHLRV